MRKFLTVLLWTILAAVLLLSLSWPRLSGLLPQTPADAREAQLMIHLYRHDPDGVLSMPLREYLIGVVAAEMPADFPPQALTAQAVAARTYIYKRIAGSGIQNRCHEAADTCSDHRHAQAWIDRQEMKKRWGMLNYYRYYQKISRAVDDSAGEIINYEGRLIDPVYHASCGGRTENSEDVWQFAQPYLRSVPCPHDTDPQPVREKAVTLEQAEQALGLELQSAAVSTGADFIRIAEHTATGRPKTLYLGGQLITAAELRFQLDLRSTNFTIRHQQGQLIFSTRGYGHGVGLCQYGAQGLAQHGYDYREIIRHYYSGVQIERFAGEVRKKGG